MSGPPRIIRGLLSHSSTGKDNTGTCASLGYEGLMILFNQPIVV